jgi:hypothetical protein
MIELKGNWIGYYTFSDQYGDWGKDKRVPFRMIIERGFSEFVGRIFEAAEAGGIDDEIIIRGRLQDDEIEFTKYYSKEHFVENEEILSLESDTPTLVYYKGKYDASENRFKGDWEIPILREDEEGVFHAENNTGHWVAWQETAK